MRRQNPPQAHIEKALQFEQYLRRSFIGSVYVGIGAVYAVLASAIFVGLVHVSLITATPIAIAVFAAVVLVPVGAALLAIFMSPNDPLSHWLIEAADKWRRPLETPPELYTFRELMISGETSCIKVTFYLPAENHTTEVKERIYNYVHGVLGRECGGREEPPTPLEIQNLLEPPMEIVASECKVPVLYWEVHAVYPMQSAFGLTQNPLAPQYWAGLGA